MCFERGLRWGGKDYGEPRILLFGGSLGIEKECVTARLGNYLRGNLFLPAFQLNSENVRTYVEKIHRSGCLFIVGYASALYALATLAAQAGHQVKLAAVFPTAELLLPEWETTIRDVLGCEVLPYYGCGEVASIGFSVPSESGYFISEEHALIEVARGDELGGLYGDGRFLITDLDNYAMPIIRYLNGDTGKIVAPFGPSSYSRIERLDGRYNSLLMTDRGELISGVIGTHVFRNTTSVKSYRIIQEEPLRIRIKVVPKACGLSGQDESLIVGLFAKYLGTRMNVSLEKVDALPNFSSGKSVFVINRCLS
jgi:phenylacetate-CoA ligase